MAKQTRTDQDETYNNSPAQEDLPGYQPYPPEDDIMRRGQRVEGNLEDQPVTKPGAPIQTTESQLDSPPEESEAPGRYDFTEEDLQALGPVDLSLDLGDDEQLKQRTQPVDFAARDLDVPGSDLDD